MKIVSKILSILLVVTMLLGVLVGCKPEPKPQPEKPKEPSEIFVDAITASCNELKKEPVIAFLQKATGDNSLNVAIEAGEDTKIDLTTYFNEKSNAASIVAKLNAVGQEIDLQMLLSEKKIMMGTSLLKDVYGIDLEKAKENFATSIFGTKGENILDITQDEENELIDALDKMEKAFKQESKNVDLYKIMVDSFKEKAKFTSDTKTPAIVAGKEIKDNTTITATLTKAQFKEIVNEVITKAELQEVVSNLIEEYNNYIVEEVEAKRNMPTLWNGGESHVFKNINDVIDYLFDEIGEKKYADTDVVVTTKLVLDKKYNSIMVATFVIGEDTIKIDCGADPKNIKHIEITYPEETIALDEAEPTKKDTIIKIDIEKDTSASTYKIVSDSLEGIQITIDKTKKTITVYDIEDNKALEDSAMSFEYDITDTNLMLKYADDEMSVKVTFKVNDISPVKYDNYKELLTMSKEDLQSLISELEPIINSFMPQEPDYEVIPGDDFEYNDFITTVIPA